MTIIKKGSIVLDIKTGKFCKVLSKPGKGELYDELMKITGLVKHRNFNDTVLIKPVDNTEINESDLVHHNNNPCYTRKTSRLLHIKDVTKPKYQN